MLTLVGKDLDIRFELPAASVLGFEHKAVTAQERAAIAGAQQTLTDIPGLLSISGKKCELNATATDFSAVLAHNLAQTQANHHDAHEHAHHSEDESGRPHGDISAQYQFICTAGTEPIVITVGKQALPFGLDKIRAMWVMENHQGATELTPGKQQLTLP